MVQPHGGPTSLTGDEWDGVAQYFVDKGYAWFAINFRGSTTYGREFERANHGVWGVADTHDCLAAHDHLSSLGWIDPTRIAIFGASYGSYMATHSVIDDTQHRFACAVAKYGDCDILTSWAQSDLVGRLDLERMMGHPRDHRAEYRAGSPIHRVDHLAVPMFIAHGELDDRVHLAQAIELVEALRRLGRPVRVRHVSHRGPRPAAHRAVPALPPPPRTVPRLVPDALTRTPFTPLERTFPELAVKEPLNPVTHCGQNGSTAAASGPDLVAAPPRGDQHMSRRNVALAMLVGLSGLAVGAAATATGVSASSDDGERITLTVGLTQDLDSPNVTAGYLVSSYELWNLQYATLTDKAAADFAHDPRSRRERGRSPTVGSPTRTRSARA